MRHLTCGIIDQKRSINHKRKKKPPEISFRRLFAEREGFEPPVPLGTPVFKTGVIDHSTISPFRLNECRYFSFSECKGTTFFLSLQDIDDFFLLIFYINTFSCLICALFADEDFLGCAIA